MMILTSIHSKQPFLLPYGLACVTAQVSLYLLFRYILPAGPWTTSPSYSAHQAVAFVVMIHWSILGVYHLNDVGESFDEDHDHEFLMLRPVSAGMRMAQLSTGALWLWDIPVSMLFNDGNPSNTKVGGGDIIMHIHHIGMLLVSCVVLGLLSRDGLPVGSNLAPIFFGVVELSSIPLQIVDLFHPGKAPSWNKWIEKRPLLTTVNELARVLFALMFLLVRGVFFPFMVITRVLPQSWAAFAVEQYRLPLSIVVSLAIPFTILQMYWAILVVKQVAKALSPKDEDKTK